MVRSQTMHKTEFSMNLNRAFSVVAVDVVFVATNG